MAVKLQVYVTEEDMLVAAVGKKVLAQTPWGDVGGNPTGEQADEVRRGLYAALGGEALQAKLDSDDEHLLLLVLDDYTAEIPWEYAVCPDGDFLGCQVGLLRLVPEAPKVKAGTGGGPVRLVVLSADPLVADDEANTPRQGYKLDIESEIDALKSDLAGSESGVVAQRIPPTHAALRKGLSRGPAILHLSCHGMVVTPPAPEASATDEEESDTEESDEEVAEPQPEAMLLLENEDGRAIRLTGQELRRLPEPGVLRLVVLSACQSAKSDANLARALVRAGIPAAVGMQDTFPDRLSGVFAATMYSALLEGQPLSRALRRTRIALSEQHPDSVGIPIGYIAEGGDRALPLTVGTADLSRLNLPQPNLPTVLLPPRPFVGRETELYVLATLMSANERVLTIVGPSGIGKSALAAAFVTRFGWRFPGGVAAVALTDHTTLGAEPVIFELVRRLVGDEAAAPLAGQPAELLVERLITEARTRPPFLLLLDNYESVLEAVDDATVVAVDQPSQEPPAVRLHRLMVKLAETGQRMLVTSRRHPTGFAGEVVYPRGGLGGIPAEAGSHLFFHYSTRANPNLEADVSLAQSVFQATEGHPLAIALLASEWDASPEHQTQEFMERWPQELAEAHLPGLPAHHVRFTVAFDRSFRRLNSTTQAQLVALSRFPAPFTVEGAAFLWTGHLPANEQEHSLTEATLGNYVRRSLLRVNGWDAENRAATYRIEPVILGVLRSHAPAEAPASEEAGYLAYADWLLNDLADKVEQDAVAAGLIWRWCNTMVGMAASQPEVSRATYSWRLARILRYFGRMTEAGQMIELGRPLAEAQNDGALVARLTFEQAAMKRIQGDLPGALALLDQSSALDKTGVLDKSALLRERAAIHATQGEMDNALALAQQALAEAETGQNIRGQVLGLRAVGELLAARGTLDGALECYEKAIQLAEANNDIQGKSDVIQAMADVVLTQGQIDRAFALLNEALGVDKATGDNQGRIRTLLSLAPLMAMWGEIAYAIGYLNEARASAEAIGDAYLRSIALQMTGEILLPLGDSKNALEFFQVARPIKEALGDLRGKAHVLRGIAQVMIRRTQYEQAAGLLQEALTLSTQVGDIAGQSATLLALAELATAQQERPQAKQHLQKALEVAQRLGDPALLGSIQEALGQVAEGQGHWKVATKHYTEALALYEGLRAAAVPRLTTRLAALEEPHDEVPAIDEWVAQYTLSAVNLRTNQQPGDELADLCQGYADSGELSAWQTYYLTGLAGMLRQPNASMLLPLLSAVKGLLPSYQKQADARDFLLNVARYCGMGAHDVAIVCAEPAIAMLRSEELTAETAETLSIALYNQSTYIEAGGRLREAVTAMEEVVRLDEQWQLADTHSDRQRLHAVQQMLADQEKAAAAA